MQSFILKICRAFLTVLGFTAIGSCRVEYGCPHADFEAVRTDLEIVKMGEYIKRLQPSSDDKP